MSILNRITAALLLAAGLASGPARAAPDWNDAPGRTSQQNVVNGLQQQVTIIRDVRYGNDDRQAMDIYLPRAAGAGMPVIFMVHGGAWRLGDKAAGSVVLNKV